jgi:hypothetical protein
MNVELTTTYQGGRQGQEQILLTFFFGYELLAFFGNWKAFFKYWVDIVYVSVRIIIYYLTA